MTKNIKCPCCLSDLVITHQDYYETLIEHVEGNGVSLKDGYQCPNSNCIAYQKAAWILEGDIWLKMNPALESYWETEEEIKKNSLTGREYAVNSFADGYHRYREEESKNTITLNLFWFIFEFSPRFIQIENSNEWKRTGFWKRKIMRKTEGRYVHFMTFWDIYYFELGNYKMNVEPALEGNRNSQDVIIDMANEISIFRKRFWWNLAHYFICWVWNRKTTLKIMKKAWNMEIS